MSQLRQRLEHSRFLANVLAALARGYISLCMRTTRWQIEGSDELSAALKNGPVMYVMWHERSLLAAPQWPLKDGQLSTLYASSPIGRVSGALQRQCGLLPMEMSDTTSNIVASRAILRRYREGVSIGLTGDGPLGPARQMKDAPLEWARRGPMPVWGYAFATAKHKQLGSWDTMRVPLPFTRGAIVFAPFEHPMTRRPTPEEIDQTRDAMAAFLDQVTERADTIVSLNSKLAGR